MILVQGLLICIAAVLYYEYKPYPLDYLPDGSLLVDPAKMRGDAYEGVGFIASFVICRILEKRQLDFDRISQKLRLFISIFALIPLYWWINTGCPYIIEEISLKPWQVPQIWAWNHIYHGAGARNGGTGRNSD